MIWLEVSKLNDLGVSKGQLHRNRKSWEFRPTTRRGRNGKLIEEVKLESLPIDVQHRYLKLEPTTNSSLTTESDSIVDAAAHVRDTVADLGPKLALDAEDRLTQALVRYRPEVRHAFIAESQRLASIIDRYQKVTPKREKRDGKFEYVAQVLELCEEAACIDPIVLAAEPSRSKPKSPHTLEAWAKAFRTDGLAVFLRKPSERTTEVDNRTAAISAGAAQWIEANWRKHPSPRHLHRKLANEAKKKNWSIPSYGWIWRKYRDLPKIVSTLTFQGTKAYTGKFAPFVPRTVEDLAALQILVGDHSVRDVSVVLPNGELARPWLTLWQDLRTGLIWGWHLDLTPSSTTIGLAYANGVRNFGAQPTANPATGYQSYLYTDQGKDYRSELLTGKTLVFNNAAKIEGGLDALCTQRNVGFMEEMGLKHIMARGYNAREKSIERTHKDISEWEKNTFTDEYCGKNAEHRPERWRAAYARHERLKKKVGKNISWLLSESPFMTLEDYRENLAGWITEYNHAEHTRSVLGGTTIVPMDEYERLYQTRYEISDDALAILLMKSAKRKIGKDGIQMHQSHWYFLHPAMGEFKGQEIEIRWTDGDYSRIWAVLPNKAVVEAELVTPSSILQPNKKTMEMVAKQKAHEKKLSREYQMVQQSNWVGENAEDRVAAMVNIEDDDQEPEAQKIAVNAHQPTVFSMTRFDKRDTTPRGISTDQVERANVVEGMFGSKPKASRIKDEWED